MGTAEGIVGYLNTKVEDEIMNLITLMSDKGTKYLLKGVLFLNGLKHFLLCDDPPVHV